MNEMWNIYSRILLGNKKEQAIDTWNSMDESQKNYTAVKEAREKKEYTL